MEETRNESGCCLNEYKMHNAGEFESLLDKISSRLRKNGVRVFFLKFLDMFD